MAFNFTNLKYGWVILTGITLGTTIYVVNNTRHQVNQADIVELLLGTTERCLATQYATNPSYYVDPPSFVRNWIATNDSATNFGGYVTNAVTNAIGWYIDRSMMVELDAKIKALVPYYADTNTVYDGTTNIAMLTVTGLWAELGIGDGTNQFTRTPAWTNNISTNYLICYTSYWPTNGATFPTTNSYTSSYNQVVNYGESWTATGGVVWASITNWPTEVVQTTNDATYGDYPWQTYPWQIYTEDLEERYKVLEALKIVDIKGAVRVYSLEEKIVYSYQSWTYQSWTDASWVTVTATNVFNGEYPNGTFFNEAGAMLITYESGWHLSIGQRIRARCKYFITDCFSTNMSITSLRSLIQLSKIEYYGYLGYDEFFYGSDSNCPGIEKEYIEIASFISPSFTNFPYYDNVLYGDSEDEIPINTPPIIGAWGSYGWRMDDYDAKGFGFTYYPSYSYRDTFIDYDFQYCTNKYW